MNNIAQSLWIFQLFFIIYLFFFVNYFFVSKKQILQRIKHCSFWDFKAIDIFQTIFRIIFIIML